LNGEIKNKNQFNNGKKIIIKRMSTKLKKIIFGKLGLKNEIKYK
jgi:hypothetical protein